MDSQVTEMFLKAVFFFIIGVVLASLFMWSMMQGIITHSNGNSELSFYYYLVG